uniref:Uncharacterized protein n=1 Tax=Mastacembelus armatus TaxID=205130 RepID=A0A3Q3L952_9TELE
MITVQREHSDMHREREGCMERSETVCCYCGVSYLIFNEFHQLNIQLAQQEAELQELRETAQREKTQREALELGRLEWEKALQMQQICLCTVWVGHSRYAHMVSWGSACLCVVKSMVHWQSQFTPWSNVS